MIDHRLISVDIGSTWTKAARFVVHNDRFDLEKRSAVPTTTDHLPVGFYAALNRLDPSLDWSQADAAPLPIFFSSSAKGGLKVAVVGLVPEMSLQIGRLAAFSAGARICAAFPYRLTRSCIQTLEQMQPDILLLCGGTDGGNERYVGENALALASSSFAGTIVYAGNNQASERVAEALAGRDVRFCENLMPDFGRLNIEPTRAAIREVFLDRIVSGKGLNQLVGQFGVEPVPTPLAVFNLVDAIGKNCPDWSDFALIDMGGATTDFYSHTEAFHAEAGAVLKGIVEPRLKRTVEGDLGLRVSAQSVFTGAQEWLMNRLQQTNLQMPDLQAYLDRLELNHDYLPDENAETHQLFDHLLAEACVNQAMLRHAGTIEQVFTTSGPFWAQHGKDLRQIKKIVGSGGYLAAQGRNDASFSFSLPAENEKISLMPEYFSYFADADYIWPLLGNLAAKFPRQAALTAISALRPQKVVRLQGESAQAHATSGQSYSQLQ